MNIGLRQRAPGVRQADAVVWSTGFGVARDQQEGEAASVTTAASWCSAAEEVPWGLRGSVGPGAGSASFLELLHELLSNDSTVLLLQLC